MAEKLFGTARISLSKIYSPVKKCTGTRAEHILKCKQELPIDRWIRHSSRQITQGTKVFREVPHFVFRPKLAPIIANPNVLGFEYYGSDRTPPERVEIDKISPEILKDSQEKLEELNQKLDLISESLS